MIKLYIRKRIDFLKDNIRNGKKYRTMRKNLDRNWFEDISELDYDSTYKFDVNDETKRNVMYIDGNLVLNMTFAETAMLYRFLKRCVYKRP